jgi:P27 family predicted phage terminase small subunit
LARTKDSAAAKKNKGAKAREGEFSVEYMEPVCPSWLSEEARAVWDRKAPPLIKVKVLSALNEDEFAEYCNLVVTLRKINKYLDTENAAMIQITEYTDNRTGITKEKMAESPYSSMRRQYLGKMNQYAMMFKLRPADMAGLYNYEKKEDDEDMFT